MNSKSQWVASWLIGNCIFAACGGTPLLPNTTGGTVGGSVVGVPTPQPLPNLLVAHVELDQSGTGSVFTPQISPKTSYVRLKLTIANSGAVSSPAGKVTVRTFQQYGVVSHTTTYPISGVVVPNGSTTVTVLAPIDRITKGWETGFVFEVKVDSLNAILEANEVDNVSMGYGYYGYDVFGEYLSAWEQVIGRGNQPIPIPKPIKDPGFFIPHLVPDTKRIPTYR